MLKFPNGNQYKLVYLDTNTMSQIAKNYSGAGKNFMEKFLNGKYMVVTSAFNIYELSNSKEVTKEQITKFFDVFPLAIMDVTPQLVEFEKLKMDTDHQMIIFAMGIKEILGTQLSTLFNEIEHNPSMQKTLSDMKDDFVKEMNEWRSLRMDDKTNTGNWMNKFNDNLIKSMNHTFKNCMNYFEIEQLGQYKSLEVLSFIKNQFIYSSKKEIDTNSVIDSYNASLFPYVDMYITERTVGSWLMMAKDKFVYLKDKKVYKVSDLYDKNEVK